MKVFKFGGASVKDADAVKNTADIIRLFPDEELTIVISAMGKTTNALEAVVNAYCEKNGEASTLLNKVKDFHLEILDALFPFNDAPVYDMVYNYFTEIEWVLEEEPREYDFVYDQIVSFGELLSTAIVSEWLKTEGIVNSLVDIRNCILTDNYYREARVNWTESAAKTMYHLKTNRRQPIVITQGFIAATTENYTTTLGREGSDYTAAILAYLLDAESVTIWKDVAGVFNADPKYFSDAQKLEQLNYLDTIELAYYGASVIHPKTIKPLENKSIPLYVKSFLNPQAKGTLVAKDIETKPRIPSFIFKSNQVLISISSKDFSFIAEENLSEIFTLIAACHIKLNLMQNSAVSFSVCADYEKDRIALLIEKLSINYKVRYNTNLQLYSVRHYYPSTIETLTNGRTVLLEQRSRTTAQLVMKAQDE